MSEEKRRTDRVDLSQIPSFSSLAAFERAATHSSFAKAAHDLGKSPSAISHAVNDLEQRFGVVLFERIGRTVRPTDAGNSYLKDIREALRILDSGRKTITGNTESKVINVHVQPLLARILIIPKLVEFKELHPDLELNIEVSRQDVDWSKRDLDIEIRGGSVSNDRLQVYDVGKIGLIPGCSSKLMEGKNGLKEISDLERFTVIIDDLRPEGWERWLRKVGYPGVELKHQLKFADLSAISSAMLSGIGVAFVPYPYVLDKPCYGTDLVLPFPLSSMDFFDYKFICRKGRENERKISVFHEWISKEFEKVNPEKNYAET